jgi:hypothetical protein
MSPGVAMASKVFSSAMMLMILVGLRKAECCLGKAGARIASTGLKNIPWGYVKYFNKEWYYTISPMASGTNVYPYPRKCLQCPKACLLAYLTKLSQIYPCFLILDNFALLGKDKPLYGRVLQVSQVRGMLRRLGKICAATISRFRQYGG